MEHKVYLQDAKEMDALSILAKISKNSLAKTDSRFISKYIIQTLLNWNVYLTH